jgi:hypothetical protein
MKKLIIATTTAIMLLGTMVPSFAEQSNENMDLKEMRRAQYFMMKQMMMSNMAHMKAQEEMMKHFGDMLQNMIDCEDKNQRDGQVKC